MRLLIDAVLMTGVIVRVLRWTMNDITIELTVSEIELISELLNAWNRSNELSIFFQELVEVDNGN
jgi:phage pi2 protein 07